MKNEIEANDSAEHVTSSHREQRIVQHLLDALERIADLKNTTQTRGPLEHMGTPKHLIDEKGWGPIQPAVKTGLCIASRIAEEALHVYRTVQVEARQ